MLRYLTDRPSLLPSSYSNAISHLQVRAFYMYVPVLHLKVKVAIIAGPWFRREMYTLNVDAWHQSTAPM